MAPYELLAQDGSIYAEERSGKPSIECLRFPGQHLSARGLAEPQAATSGPTPARIAAIREIFPMFELTLDGLEQAVTHLMRP